MTDAVDARGEWFVVPDVLDADEVCPGIWVGRLRAVPEGDGRESVHAHRPVRRRAPEASAAGGRVLVTCRAGLNRSALVAALAMRMRGYKIVVELLRNARGFRALSNTCFRRIATGENRATEFHLGE